jgi:hypothetical protein
MMRKSIEEAVALGIRMGYAFIATADREGLPHVGSSGSLELDDSGRLAVSEWFCPGTLSNLEANPRISVVVWDPESDSGYQMLGRSEGVREIAMMDGLIPESEAGMHIPQVERKILIRVDTVVRFSRAPHSDIEE